MSAPRLLLHADRQASAWANGAGVTYQVMAVPEGAGFLDFDWRVSFAEVAGEGPFSVLPGVDRVLVLVEGQGMELTIDGALHLVKPLVPVAFRGEAHVESRLPLGPTADLNLMTRRERVSGRLSLRKLSGTLTLTASAGTELLAVLDGECTISGTASRLGPRDCALLTDAVTLLGRATLALMRMLPAAAQQPESGSGGLWE
ncbi:MAG: HutD/Ves family protein [Candidatus Nanopelagicales bacterium]